LKDDFGYNELGGNVICTGGAFDYSSLGATHHSPSDFAVLKNIENSELVYPGSAVEYRALFKQFYNNSKLTYCRLPKTEHGYVFYPEQIKLGKAMKFREGKDLTIVAVGSQLKTVIKAAEEVDAEVIYVHTIKPLDTKTIWKSITKTLNCVVIEELSESGGIYEDVLRLAQGTGIKVRSISIPSRFIHEYGTYEQHCERLGFTVENLLEKGVQR